MPEQAISTNPLVRALRFVLNGAADLVVFDYSAPRDFRRLWSFELAGWKRFLIVWPRTAPDPEIEPIDAEKCLSPVDWAACYARQTEDKPQEWPEVLVLDLDAERQESFPSVAYRNALVASQLPWLRVVRGAELSSITGWLANPLDRDGDGCKGALKRFLREIKLNLTEVKSEGATLVELKSDGGYDRHAIANLIGPMILRGDVAQKTLHSAALLTLLQSCGLAAPLGAVAPSIEATKLETETAGLQCGSGLHVLLVDDQEHQGWTTWVRERLPKAEVRARRDPTALVHEIQKQLDAAGTKDLRFRLRLPDMKEGTLPVLLLDLRLFSGDSKGELSFLKNTLLPLLARFANGRNLAWPGFTADELKSAEDWCKQPARDTDAYLHVLSLLPRLLALADLSIPIVLFSSTGQRRIVEFLKPYGSIITTFEKPHLAALLNPDLVKDANSRFVEAMTTAVQLARAAAMIRKVNSLPLSQYEQARQLFQGRMHVEIFHDESQHEYSHFFRVAAFAVGFSSKEAADRVNTYIDKNGPRFFGANRLPQIKEYELIEEARTQWHDDIAPALVKAFELDAIRTPYLLPFVVVSGSTVESAPDDDPYALLDPTGLDNKNQELLRLLIEVMIVDTLAWVSEERQLRCDILGATRMRCIETQDRLTKDQVETQLASRWGVKNVFVTEPRQDVKSGKWRIKWQSLRRESFHGALNELLDGRRNSTKGSQFARRIFRALCLSIPQENASSADRDYRFLHSIADSVSRLFEVDLTNKHVTWGLKSDARIAMATCGAAGLVEQIIRILNCHRALDEDDVIDGFGYGLGVNHEHDVAGNIVALRLRDQIPHLSGKEFLRIVEHVKAGGPRWTHSPRLKGARSECKPQSHNKSRPSRRTRHQAHTPPKVKPQSPSKGGPSATSGYRLNIKLPARGSVSSPAEAIIGSRPGGQAEQVAAGPTLNELRRKWRIRRFASIAAYDACGIAWHQMEGFYVRVTSSQKVTVVAELERVREQALQGFSEPDNRNLFREDGQLCGWPYPRSG